MGTKRVGWARIRSLINENTNDLKHRRTTVKTAITADTTLTHADCGSVILLDGSAAANIEITLPDTPSLGDEFKFVLAATSNAAAQILIDSNGANHKFEGYTVMYKADMADGTTAFHSHRKLGWGDAAAKGGCLHVVCIATGANARWAILDAKSDVAWITAHA